MLDAEGASVSALIDVTNVESYDRRIQSAINIQGKKMQRRAEFHLTRVLRQAGRQKVPRLTCFKSPLKTTRRAW